MEVKVTCPKCGQTTSVPTKQVVREVRCRACSHQFVPVREGVPCPQCGSVIIVSAGQSLREVVCLECSFAFRKGKWWLKRKYLILEGIVAVVLVLVILMFLRARSNKLLAKELRAEFKAWLATLPKVPDSENGMLVILQGTNYLGNYQPYFGRLSRDKFSFQKQADVAFLRGELTKCQKALELIYAGLKYEKFMCPTDYSKGPWAKIPDFLGIKIAAHLIALKGELAEFEGRKSEALKEYLNTLRLGRTLANERFLISRMIEVAVLQIGMQPLTRTLSEDSLSESDLRHLLGTLVELYGRGGDCYSLFENEYYCFAYIAAGLIEGDFGYRDIGYDGDGLESIRFSKYIYNYRSDAEKYRKMLEIARKVDPAKYYSLPPEAKDKQAFIEKVGMGSDERTLAEIGILGPNRCIKVLVEVEVLWRGAIAMAAVRLFDARNGRLPKNLDELGELVPKDLLTDPFSGNNLIYRVSGNDFYLYSVGFDSVDGRGINDSPIYHKDQYPQSVSDIIFHAPGAQGDK